jgi:polysaccharide export outer membrane protein
MMRGRKHRNGRWAGGKGPVRTGIFTLTIGAMFLTSTVSGPAQTSGQKSPSAESIVLDKLQTPQRVESAIPMSATVNPEKYYVGPSDVLSVNLWTSPPVQYRIEVTPEGTLIVPTVGEIPVAGMLLSKAKEKVLGAVKQRFLSINASVTLVRPRSIIVSVRGQVLHEGEYTMYGTDRADLAIHEANTPSSTEENEKVAGVLYEMSLRRITISHRDGPQTPVDLVKFLATKDDNLDPYLREGDVIVVPRKDVTKNVFGIYGEVNLPGRYEFVPGDRLSDAISIGQGFTAEARADSSEFSRLSDDGRVMTRKVVDLSTLIAGSPADVLLAPGDRIVVRGRTELRADYRVRIEGEVLHPGVYPITRDRTKISEVIRQAGGFTEFAALTSAELNRHSIQPQEVELDRLMSLRGGVSQEDSLDYIRETDLRLRKEIVNVDFVRLFTQGDSLQDVYLQDEDVIRVPSVNHTIYVFGQIVSPGHIPFLLGEGPDYYIRKAGGYTDRARQGDIRVIKNKTKQWLAPDETEMEEGDYIWVPKEPDRSFSYYVNNAAAAASVLSVIIGMAAVIISLSK